MKFKRKSRQERKQWMCANPNVLDLTIPEIYKKMVAAELYSEKTGLNDGEWSVSKLVEEVKNEQYYRTSKILR